MAGPRRLAAVRRHLAASAEPRAPDSTLCLDILTEDDPWPHEFAKARNGGPFVRCVSVWGVPILATAAAPEGHLAHAANVLAQWLDNDEDGVPDCPEAVAAMVASDAVVIMAADAEEQNVVEPAAHALGLGQTQGCRVNQTHPDGGAFDTGPLEEILHLVMDTGYGAAFDDLDSQEGNDRNRISVAMDAARGGRFLGVPPGLEGYPAGAWYSYDAPSCTCKPGPSSRPPLYRLRVRLPSSWLRLARPGFACVRRLPEVRVHLLAAHQLPRRPGRPGARRVHRLGVAPQHTRKAGARARRDGAGHARAGDPARSAVPAARAQAAGWALPRLKARLGPCVAPNLCLPLN